MVCLENFRFDDVTRRALHRLIADGRRLFLTLDVQKIYSPSYNIINEDYTFFREFKDNIREIHIHDLSREFGAHQIVGTGIVDFNLMRQFANDNTYLNFEVRPVEAAAESKVKLFNIWNI
jgi:sugar phosphate isomerase/epimerase